MKNIERFQVDFLVFYIILAIFQSFIGIHEEKTDKELLWLNQKTIAVTLLIFLFFKEKNRSGWLILYMRTQSTSCQIVSDTVKPD